FVSLLLAVSLAKPFDFYSHGPYVSSVPRPESILGYGPGERHTNFRDQERVMLTIAESAKDRVKVVQYGVTAEGRPLRIYIVSTAHNMSRLAEIKAQHAELAKGGGDPDKTVPIVWINECIHGDETASFEAGMWTFYNLVAGKGSPVAKALENEVVILNPVYNPDGHERYVVYYNSVATGSDDPNAYEDREPSVVFGRLNHYRFDMNRDRVAFSQDETRAEFAEMLRWNPQVYIDQHGQVGSYFFPPEPMSINTNVDRARNAKWTDVFGRATGKAFDANGFSYYVKDEFDLYYPGYLDASNTLSGAIGMTHETDGGRLLAHRREDGSVLTLRQGMAKHFTSALAVAEATAAHGQELDRDYAAFKKRATSGESAGKFKRVVLTCADSRPLLRLKTQLGYAGIAAYFTKPFSQPDAHDYWSKKTGAAQFSGQVLVVDMAQPQGALAKALLEPGSDFEPEFSKAQIGKKAAVPDGEKYPGPEGTEFYDVTGWALPYAYDLAAWWCESAPTEQHVEPAMAIDGVLGHSTAGYALRYHDMEDVLAVFDALDKGARGGVTTKPMKLGSASFPAGTFIFPAGRNEDGYEAVLADVAKRRHVWFEPLETTYPEEDRYGPGSGAVVALKKPSIAFVMGSGEQLAQAGAIWYLMDRVFHLPYTAISGQALASGDISRYTCIILPPGASLPSSDKVKGWLSQGNVAIGLGGTAWFSGFGTLDPVKGEFRSLPGALFRAQMDMRSPLTYGYEGPDVAVPVGGSRFFEKRKTGGGVITLSSDEKAEKLLTGWEWPDETEKALKGTVFLHDEPVGAGHIFLYTQDPTERCLWPGLYKTLLNAMLMGAR
ncbi:MAG TPA: M14 family zinc carboxypeptidase, partial [Fimbriimonadaceae bacterium]|nr:M14 family zinc carboxypeptidase [Fimbriimonadaceae bacterium]